MLSIRTILCPTDLSERSAAAFDVACALARDSGARLVVMHVLPSINPEPRTGPHRPPPLTEQMLAELKAYREEMRRRFAALLAPELGVRMDRMLKEGDAASNILHAAEETNCELIVLGTHGRTADANRLMGSVAEVVSQKAPCAVLTVKASGRVAG